MSTAEKKTATDLLLPHGKHATFRSVNRFFPLIGSPTLREEQH